ncbi:MAG: hypothetical protein ACI8X5_000721 [Planctomycetota bacterium]|jgi:hypothetical protein
MSVRQSRRFDKGRLELLARDETILNQAFEWASTQPHDQSIGGAAQLGPTRV